MTAMQVIPPIVTPYCYADADSAAAAPCTTALAIFVTHCSITLPQDDVL